MYISHVLSHTKYKPKRRLGSERVKERESIRSIREITLLQLIQTQRFRIEHKINVPTKKVYKVDTK